MLQLQSGAGGSEEESEDIGEVFAAYGARKANSQTNLSKLSPFSVSNSWSNSIQTAPIFFRFSNVSICQILFLNYSCSLLKTEAESCVPQGALYHMVTDNPDGVQYILACYTRVIWVMGNMGAFFSTGDSFAMLKLLY